MLEAKGKYIIRSIFESMMEDDNAQMLLPNDWRIFLRGTAGEAGRARIISDYIAGMTDSYAQKVYANLFVPHRGSIYEIL